jgi:hypothetical protein
MARRTRTAAVAAALISAAIIYKRTAALRRHVDVLNRVDTGSVFASAKAAADN